VFICGKILFSGLFMNTVLIALGNPLLSDEGVGVHILQEIEKRVPEPRPFDLLDSGNSSMRVLHSLKDRKKAVFVDCALMGAKPGEMRRFTPEEVSSVKNLRGFSFHEGDLLKTLELAKMLGDLPEQVMIFGIQPASLDQGEKLSSVLATNFDVYIERVLKELDINPTCNKDSCRK
jgi:hydrogenase maturation protease